MALRVAYAGYDFLSSCLEMLINSKEADVVICLTGTAEETTVNTLRLAHDNGISVISGRPIGHVAEVVRALNIDLLVCAAYGYKIPVDLLDIPRALNIHPSLLPFGRGPIPIPYFVDGGPSFRDHCGISLHILTSEFDRGPILHQRKIEITENDGFDELSLKIFNEAPALLAEVLSNIDEFFDNAIEQGEGSYWPLHSENERSVEASRTTVAQLSETLRKFGLLGVIVKMSDGRRIQANRLTVIASTHGYTPGSVVATFRHGWLVAMADGIARLDSPTILD